MFMRGKDKTEIRLFFVSCDEISHIEWIFMT